ncbi:MAG: motility protein A, partial [Pseudobdellovibrionaceae bacterium]
MGMTTILGLLVGIGGILLGNVLEGGHLGSLVQGAALVIVLTGTCGAVMVSSRKEDLKLGLQMFKKAFQKSDHDTSEEVLKEIIDCARLARKESILSIESRINRMADPFMQNVMRAVVD